MAKIVVTESGVVTVGDGDTVIIEIPGGGEVTIVADPNENVDKVKIEFIDDSQADVVTIQLDTFSEDDLHIDIRDYDSSDTIRLVGAYDTYVDPDDVDEYTFQYIGLDGETYSGFVHAKDKGERDFTADPAPIIICFCSESQLKTSVGWKRADELKPYDCLFTLDSGFQPIIWVGSQEIYGSQLINNPTLWPVIIEPGALGNKSPRRRLRVSPHHRVLVSGWQVELNFGCSEVLVPAKSLINNVDIYVDSACQSVQYFHFLLEAHSILNAEGCMSESLLVAPQSKKSIAMNNLDDNLLQDLGSEYLSLSTYPARPILKVREGRLLALDKGHSPSSLTTERPKLRVAS